MDDLNSTVGIVALAAAAAAGLTLLLAIVLAVKLRRLRRAQTAVLGGQETDLVAHAETQERRFRELTDFVNEAAERLDARMREAETRLEGALSHRAVVRYDAYNEMSGQQSSSVALLDAHGSGLVLSSILHREHARLYAKPVVNGRGVLELSPEEEQAIQEATRARPWVKAEAEHQR